MKKSLAVLLAALIVHTFPALAACTNPQGWCTVGPGIACEQLIYDTQFSEWDGSSCVKWVGSGWTSYHANDGSDYFWEIQSWGGNVYQQFSIPSDTDIMDVSATIYLVKSTVGTERITVEITNTSGTVLQSLGTYYASSSGTTISVSTDATPYPGQNVRLRFRVTSGNAPGDTLFHVTKAHVRVYNVP